MNRIANACARLSIFLRRLDRAWRYYRILNYSWRLSWAKAGWQSCE